MALYLEYLALSVALNMKAHQFWKLK